MFDKNTTKRYSIDKLYNRFYCSVKSKDIEDRVTQYTLNNSYSIRSCIVGILKSNNPKGSKNSDLQRIVIILKRLNKM